MSGRRRRFPAEFKVEGAHRVIDTGRAIADVTRELTRGNALLANLVHAERAELLCLRKQVSELGKRWRQVVKRVVLKQRESMPPSKNVTTNRKS